MWARGGSKAELLGSDGQLKECEEFHRGRALGDLHEVRLECDGTCSWFASLRRWSVEMDGQVCQTARPCEPSTDHPETVTASPEQDMGVSSAENRERSHHRRHIIMHRYT